MTPQSLACIRDAKALLADPPPLARTANVMEQLERLMRSCGPGGGYWCGRFSLIKSPRKEGAWYCPRPVSILSGLIPAGPCDVTTMLDGEARWTQRWQPGDPPLCPLPGTALPICALELINVGFETSPPTDLHGLGGIAHFLDENGRDFTPLLDDRERFRCGPHFQFVGCRLYRADEQSPFDIPNETPAPLDDGAWGCPGWNAAKI